MSYFIELWGRAFNAKKTCIKVYFLYDVRQYFIIVSLKFFIYGNYYL